MKRAVPLVVGLGLVAFVALFVVGPYGEPACAAQAADQRVDLRVLLVSVDGDDEGSIAWRDLFVDEGVPYEELHLGAGAVLDDDVLYAPDGHARFQGIVLADSRLADDGRPDLPSRLDDDARSAIDDFQRDTGARLLAATIVPDAALPVTVPPAPSDLDGLVGRVTAAGREVFPYLQGDVPIEDSFGFVPEVTTSSGLVPLVALPDRRPLVVVAHGAGATETLYVAPQVSEAVLHWRLLRHGLLGWVTGGVHVGLRYLHYAMQVDDIFLPNFRWDPERDHTSAELGTSHMTPEDMTVGADWIREHGLRLDMTYNAAGRTSATCEAVLGEKEAFGWVNHTYSHLDLDELPREQIVQEIDRNRRWAENHDLPGFRGDELVTGAHTGLENPDMPAALRETGIRWVASDASLEPEQRRLGDALTVPRYPTDIYYDTSTRAEQLDEYDHAYLVACDPTLTTCRTEPATWGEFVEIQAELMFRHIIDGDPRVHYAHQSNMTDDRILYDALEAMLDRYHSLIDAPIVQPTLSESGTELLRQARWADALASGAVEAWREHDELHITATVDVDVPMTGVADGDDYAGERIGWFPIDAGEELVLTQVTGR